MADDKIAFITAAEGGVQMGLKTQRDCIGRLLQKVTWGLSNNPNNHCKQLSIFFSTAIALPAGGMSQICSLEIFWVIIETACSREYNLKAFTYLKSVSGPIK